MNMICNGPEELVGLRRVWPAQGDSGWPHHHNAVHLAGVDLLLHHPALPAAALPLHRQGPHVALRLPHHVPALLPLRSLRHRPPLAGLSAQREATLPGYACYCVLLKG